MVAGSYGRVSQCSQDLRWNQDRSLQGIAILHEHAQSTYFASSLSGTQNFTQMKQKVEATGHQFMTCSALCQDGLSHIFDESIRQTLQKQVDLHIKKKEEEKFCQLI